jgi:hypothetical protein
MADDPKEYTSAVAFRRALEDRLKAISREQSIPLDRLRRRVTFDRFLARIFDNSKPRPPFLLKGGYALEFRFHDIARTTKDIDFSMPYAHDVNEETIRGMLQAEAKKDMSDWFVFYIGVPMREFDQAVYGGWRYPVEARVAGRIFTQFHIDVGIGDAVVSDAEWQMGDDVLRFAGIEPAYVALLPTEQHFAEKLHAYSFPRDKRPFSRMRDLVDLVLLIEQGLPDKALILSAVRATFERRKTHAIPDVLEMPPVAMEGSYVRMAKDCGVAKKTMADAFAFLQEFWAGIRR